MSLDLSVTAAIALAETLLAPLPLDRLGTDTRQSLVGVLALVELTLFAGALALAFARFERACEGPGACRGADWLLRGAAALAASALLQHIHRQPSADLLGLASRWDHVFFALLAGLPLRRAPAAVRLWILCALSLAFVGSSVGWLALGGILGGCLLGHAATQWAPTRRTSLQVLLLLAILLWLWSLRSGNRAASLHGVGLFVFVALRHLSFVLDAQRGARTSVAGYVCFLLFYPSCIGATEVFREFRQHNLESPPPIDYRAGAIGVARGTLLSWLALQVPMTGDLMTRSDGFLEIWQNLLLFYFRVACFGMGIWSLLEAGALFLGIRLRPNFRGVLLARNPSQFWRAWRGTMANWLIQHIYIPLGGGRRHRTRNILVVFAFSTVWHCIGIPFLRPASFGFDDALPILAWGALNFFGVAGHAWFRRAWTPRARGPIPRGLIAAGQWALTMCFGSLTVALLGFATTYVERFPHVVRTLCGLAGW